MSQTALLNAQSNENDTSVTGTSKADTQTSQTDETQETPKQPTLTEQQKSELALATLLLGSWAELGSNTGRITNKSAQEAARRCGQGSDINGDVLYFKIGNRVQRLDVRTGKTTSVQRVRQLPNQGDQRGWVMAMNGDIVRVRFRDLKLRNGTIAMLLEQNTVYLNCASIIALR